MVYAIAIVVLASLVGLFVLIPLRSGIRDDIEHTEDERRAGLEAAKEAKYREIRDAELDYRMGKLSEADWRATDRELRAQAIAILKELDDLPAPETPGEDRPPAREDANLSL